MSGFEFKIFSSLVKVFPHCIPKTESNTLSLSALIGENVSFQIAYRFNSDAFRSWGKIKVSTNDNLHVTLRRVRYLPGSIPSQFKADDGYITTESGLFPELLEPLEADRLPLISGSWQVIWVDIEASSQITAKDNLIDISLETASGDEIASAQVSLAVINTELPPLHIPHTRWFHTDCLAEYYDVPVFSKRYWEIVEHFAAYAVKHGINMLLTPIFTPPLDTEVGSERLTVQLVDVEANDGKYRFSFEKLDQWIDMCERVGVVYYEMAHLFTQWGAKHAPKIMVTSNGQYIRKFGWETDATGAEYTNFLQQFLPALTAKLRQRGIANRTYFHISDEPTLKDMEQYANARKIVEPFLTDYRIIDALTDFDFFKQGVVSIPIPSVDHIEPFIESDARGELPELWAYYCCGQSYKVPNLFFMQPSYRNRILGVLIYKYQIDGFLQWGYNFYNTMHSVERINPFLITDADGTFPSGDAFIVYPGDDGQPLGSIRLMVANEAFNDLRALKLLEQLAGRDYVLTLIAKELTESLTFDCFPKSEAPLLSLRATVNKEIMNRL